MHLIYRPWKNIYRKLENVLMIVHTSWLYVTLFVKMKVLRELSLWDHHVWFEQLRMHLMQETDRLYHWKLWKGRVWTMAYIPRSNTLYLPTLTQFPGICMFLCVSSGLPEYRPTCKSPELSYHIISISKQPPPRLLMSPLFAVQYHEKRADVYWIAETPAANNLLKSNAPASLR